MSTHNYTTEIYNSNLQILNDCISRISNTILPSDPCSQFSIAYSVEIASFNGILSDLQEICTKVVSAYTSVKSKVCSIDSSYKSDMEYLISYVKVLEDALGKMTDSMYREKSGTSNGVYIDSEKNSLNWLQIHTFDVGSYKDSAIEVSSNKYTPGSIFNFIASGDENAHVVDSNGKKYEIETTNGTKLEISESTLIEMIIVVLSYFTNNFGVPDDLENIGEAEVFTGKIRVSPYSYIEVEDCLESDYHKCVEELGKININEVTSKKARTKSDGSLVYEITKKNDECEITESVEYNPTTGKCKLSYKVTVESSNGKGKSSVAYVCEGDTIIATPGEEYDSDFASASGLSRTPSLGFSHDFDRESLKQRQKEAGVRMIKIAGVMVAVVVVAGVVVTVPEAASLVGGGLASLGGGNLILSF